MPQTAPANFRHVFIDLAVVSLPRLVLWVSTSNCVDRSADIREQLSQDGSGGFEGGVFVGVFMDCLLGCVQSFANPLLLSLSIPPASGAGQ